MRIVLIISQDNTYQPLVYEPFVARYTKEVAGLIVVPFVPTHKTKFDILRFLWDLYGVKGFVYKFYQVVKNRLLSLVSRFITLSRCYSLHDIARHYHIPHHTVENINSPEALEIIRQYKPDIIISAQGQLLKKEILSIPRLGVLNKHAGALPRYRGSYPVFWAMLNDEQEIGVSVHMVNEKLDSGDIIIQEMIPIEPNDTFESLYRQVIQLSPRLLSRAVETLMNGGEYPVIRNDDSQASSFGYPDRESIRMFKKKGKRIL